MKQYPTGQVRYPPLSAAKAFLDGLNHATVGDNQHGLDGVLRHQFAQGFVNSFEQWFVQLIAIRPLA